MPCFAWARFLCSPCASTRVGTAQTQLNSLDSIAPQFVGRRSFSRPRYPGDQEVSPASGSPEGPHRAFATLHLGLAKPRVLLNPRGALGGLPFSLVPIPMDTTGFLDLFLVPHFPDPDSKQRTLTIGWVGFQRGRARGSDTQSFRQIMYESVP